MNELSKILKSNNVKPTAMRILILRVLLSNKIALSLTDLEKSFEKSERTTIFRTIKTFIKNGIVHQIDDGTSIPKYALCEENCQCDINTDLHLHFHCSICNETRCISEQKLPNINLPQGFIALGANLVVKGVCDKCNNK